MKSYVIHMNIDPCCPSTSPNHANSFSPHVAAILFELKVTLEK